MLRVVFIRHSITEGNKLKRYIGTTDEPLCFEGVNLLKERKYPGVEAIFTSPMLRCKETAGIIYNGMDYRICQGFREINFGDFENKNYKELDGKSLPDAAWRNLIRSLISVMMKDLRLLHL